MTEQTGATQTPPPRTPTREAVVIEPRSNTIFPDWRELWAFRNLFRALVWRNFKVRYRNTALGVMWVVLQPLTMMLVFTMVFGLWVRMPLGDIPYSIHILTGLVLVFFINRVISESVNIIRSNQALTGKVYFPKLILPFALVAATIVDLVVMLAVLLLIMAMQGVYPSPRLLMLCYFLGLLVAWGVALSVCLAALGIRYRDLFFFMPIINLMLMYLAPVVYPITLVPEKYLPLLALNPLVGIVNGFRWALLDTQPFHMWLSYIALAEIALMGLLGLIYFMRTEYSFNDFL